MGIPKMEVLNHFSGHVGGVYPRNHSPKKRALYMVGTSIKSAPGIPIDIHCGEY